ncbi:hypothetical protein [Bifidobacterium sp. SO1]|uniref:hypothetical protein n=1 Tax=Bifidobacterium sp. SO1 TaxID=2809029 RepID=UPI001BDD5A80|nr:hypothetical protein [Bifidobacterium sp. SO1]MBT1162226.1 hypothetical protein [Bifidobacterium sp. SO1]
MTRITTLMPATDPMQRSKQLPKLNLDDTPWTICRKIGSYLLSSLNNEQIEQTALNTARWLIGDKAEPITPEPESLASYQIAKITSEARTYRNDDGTWAVIAFGSCPKTLLGDHTWHWNNRRERERTRIVGVRLPVIVGAMRLITPEICEIVNGNIPEQYRHYPTADSMIMRLISEDCKYQRAIHVAVNVAAKLQWPVEERVELAIKWKNRRIAGVFEDKKHCDDKHRQAALSSMFGRTFQHVEIDDGVDLDLYRALDAEFAELWAACRLPMIDTVNAFRFRLTGRHRATGVYHPVRRAIAVDPRHPDSTWHEMSHAWDAEHGWVSLSPRFQPTIDAYVAALDTTGMTDSQLNYALTPCEIFARCSEYWAMRNHMGGSFAKTTLEGNLYEPFATMGDQAYEFFSNVNLFAPVLEQAA